MPLYKECGNGRDTYISFDNGGQTKMHQPAKQISVGTMYTRGPFRGRKASASSYQSANVTKQPLTVIYKCDGTGRDSYISANNGGFASSFYSSKNYEGDFR